MTAPIGPGISSTFSIQVRRGAFEQRLDVVGASLTQSHGETEIRVGISLLTNARLLPMTCY
jgi:hypothetical protein